MSLKTSPTFCPLPFMHSYITANGSLVGCCESQETVLSNRGENFRQAWANANYQSLREALLKGEKPQACWKCWKNEDVGLRSNREEALADWHSGRWGEPNQILKESLTPPQPVFVEMKCNNICNLKCQMCYPDSSHRLMEDRDILDKYRGRHAWSEKPLSSQMRIDELLHAESEDLKKIRVLQFSGGEPLLSREQYSVVKRLLTLNPEEISLRYATNLTHLRFEDFDYPNIWRQFRQVNVKVSMDGLNDVYDYIRVGAKFERILTNFKRLLDLQLPNLSLAIGFTTQVYNVFQVAEFVDYFAALIPRGAISTHILHKPDFFKIDAYPLELREKIVRKIRARRSDLESICTVLENAPAQPEKWEKLQNYTREMEAKYANPNGFAKLLQRHLDL